MKYISLLLFASAITISACQQQNRIDIRDDFKGYYDTYQVEGSFILYDQMNDKFIAFNQYQLNTAFTPASTFKICNSLIGLEAGIIQDENFVIPWDSVQRPNPAWNADQNLKSAFKNSTVWYYQEIAHRVGGEQMKYWLDKAAYGNSDTSGGIDQFWLKGGLRISPQQQIDFLRRLQGNMLPFSQRSIDIVKEVMIVPETQGYVMRAKTGWGVQGDLDIGWYVGWIESTDNVYFFVNCIQSDNLHNERFAEARVEIAEAILRELNVITD